MKRKLLLLLGSIVYILTCYFLAMQLAYFLSFGNNFEAMQAATKVCFNPAVLWWQGNNNFFKLSSIIIFSTWLIMLLSILFPGGKRDNKRRGLTHNERIQYSHLASRHEAKKGLQRFQFNRSGFNDDMFRRCKQPLLHWQYWVGLCLVLSILISTGLLISDGVEILVRLCGNNTFHLKWNIYPWTMYAVVIISAVFLFYGISRCHIRDYCDLVFDPFKRKWNSMITYFKLQDSKKFNTVRYQTINGKPDCRRAGLPIMTRRNKIWVEPGDNHSLVIGTTNSGKTYSTIMIFIMTVLMADTSAFINDIKGELTPQFAPLFKARGYNVVVLNFVDSRKSECWNPFGTVYKAYRAEQARTVDNPSAWKTINDMNAYKQAKVNALKALQNTIRVYEQAKRLGERTSDIVAKLQNATENMRKKMQAVWNIEDSDGFPQPDFSDANIKLEDICRMLCEDTNAKDPHWWQSAKSLMDGLLSFLLEYEYLDDDENICRLDEDVISFPNIQSLRTDGFTPVDLDGGQEKTLLIQWFLSMTKRSSDRSAEKLNPICYMGADERGSVMSTFADKMQIGMISERVKQMTSRTTFDFDDIFSKKSVVFMIVNDEKKLFHPFVSIFVSQLYQEMVDFSRNYPKQRLPIPFDIIWDEFGISPAVGDIHSKLASSRYRGVRWHFVVQEYSQIDQTYGKEEARTIKGNIMNTVYLLAETPATLEEISKRAGQQKIWNKEKQIFDVVPVISTDRLQHLSLSEALILRQRKMPYLTRYLAFDKYVFAKKIKKYESKPYYDADDKGEPISKLQRYTNFSLLQEYEKLKRGKAEANKKEKIEMDKHDPESMDNQDGKGKYDEHGEFVSVFEMRDDV